MSSPTNKDLTHQNKRNGRGSALGTALTLFACIAVVAFVGANRQAITDWIRLRGYAPPSYVSRLADQDGMNGYTRHLFYLNRPRLLSDVKTFRKDCPENENTIVLGCYHPGEDGIYLYDVHDAKLAGVQQVTAAHEVLHAVYERLSASDRQALNRQLEDFYKHGLKDQRVLDEVRLYQKTEPHDVLDEMSCTFGTEVADLPPGLEAYYARYFNDRSAVVAYEQKYEGEFTRRQELIRNYDAQLSGLKSRIDTAQVDLQDRQSALNAEQNRLNAENNSGDVNAYNADVPVYNRMVDAYNAEITSTQALVGRYNQIVASRNEVAGELADLAKALDTRLTPQQTR